MFNPKIKLNFLFFFLILSCVFLAYFNTLNNPFIWDDDALVVKNTLVKDLKFLPKLFSSDLYYGISSGSNFYRPIQALSYMCDYYLWQLDPKGYHITNILLQALVSFLVFILINAIVKKTALAFAAALFFSVSPVHTEAVSYISGRADMLMGIFLLSSLILFIKSQGIKYRLSFVILSHCLFVLGLLSKELAVVFPIVILAYVYYFKKKPLSSIPFFIISGVYLLLRLSIFQFITLRPPALTRFPFFLRITVLPKVIFTYLKLLILPTGLHMSRELVRPVSFLGIFIAWLALGALVAGCIYLLKYKEKRIIVSFFLAWFIIFLLPQSGLFPINAFVSEHFIYLSSISFFTGLSYLLFRLLKKRVFIFSVFLILLSYGLLTHSRNLEWGNPRVFFERIIKYSPDSFQAYNNLGLEYERSLELDKALDCYKNALMIMPDLLEAHSNLANVYFKMGRFDDCEKEYLIVEKTAPPNKAGEVANNIGALYEMQGKPDAAVLKYRSALKLDPSLKFSHFNIARIELLRGNRGVVALEILSSLSEELQKDNPVLKIIYDFLKAEKGMPPAAAFYNDLGVKFAESMFFNESILAFDRALELDLSYADAHFNLGLAYLNKGLEGRAVSEFKFALKIDPGHSKASGLLADIRKNIFKK